MTRISRIALTAAAVFAATGTAQAHTGLAHTSSFTAGFTHPIGGTDHVLAMVAVGLLAAIAGGRALWLLPLSFVGTMMAGGAIGLSGANLAGAETAIALSVLVFGAMVAWQKAIPTAAAATIVALFALFHGFAHGTEMPLSASGFAYSAGFVAATALLHGAGIGLGVIMAKATRHMTTAAGGALALAGLGLLTQTL
jgi:urease accessory protein